jgi:hypothetical protein
MQLGWRDATWLAVALMLHGSLLLISFKPFPAELADPRVLALSLVTSIAPQADTVKTPIPAQPPDEAIPEPDDRQPEENRPAALPQSEPVEKEPAVPPDRITTARLLDSASQLKWALPAPARDRKLGVHHPREAPENWRPGISLEDNLFNGMTVPEKVEIVDQWMSADGSQNVVINTPTGETLCGRRQAWDPLNPMLEQLMMFRTCGGGKRTFKMPDRFNRHLVD